MGIYLLYLLPYTVVSYYERYAIPLLGAKVLLVMWAADRLLPFLANIRKTKTMPSSQLCHLNVGQE